MPSRCLILFPPQWIPTAPHLVGPAIHSILKNNGHDVRLVDLNAEFYETVLTPQYLYDAVKAAFDDFKANADAIFRACPDEAALKDRPKEFQAAFLRYREIYRMARRDEYRDVIRRIETATATYRDKDAFYDPKRVDEATEVIVKACGILSAVHHPSWLYFLTPNVKIYYSVESLREDCENAKGNIFRGFFAPRLAGLLRDDPRFIGISIGDYSQLLPGLTLAMMLKEATDAHVCIGGNLFGRYTDVLVNNPEFFRLFADSVILNEGERPVIELLRHLEGKIAIGQVPNLMYLTAEGKIAVNDEAPPIPAEELFPPEFADLQANRYFLPEFIYNVQASRSCYWRKCVFCTHHAGSRYAVKPVARMIAELRALQAAHGARYFHFVDEAVSPAYLRRLAAAIIDAGLEINFYIYARFEEGFDEDLFRLAHRAGLRMVLWGFESASERVYRLMNKGPIADKRARLKILEAAYAAGVWNFCFLMFGFPTETLAEAKETVDFVRDNRRLLSHGTGSTFMLVGDSPMLRDLAKYSITAVQRVRNGFNFAHKYTATRGMTKEEKKELERYKHEQWRLAEMQCRGSAFREKLFLYVCRFGVERVSAMNETVWL